MRIVLIGISHWHTPFYSDPVLGIKNATIVGVSDPDAERTAPPAAQAKCPVSLAGLDMATFLPRFCVPSTATDSRKPDDIPTREKNRAVFLGGRPRRVLEAG